MGQADLGVKVFLIDNLTSPIGLLSSAMGLFGSGLVSGMMQAAGMSERLSQLGEESARLSAAMTGLTNDGNLLFTMLQNGTITEAQYDEAMMRNLGSYEQLSTQMAANTTQTEQLNGDMGTLSDTMTLFGEALGAGVDFAAFTAGLTAADRDASDLTNTMNRLSIAGNLNNTQLQQMQNYLFQVAQNSKYSADTVGQAWSMLLEKGQTAQGIISGMGQDVVRMAEAMGQNNATAAATTLAGALQIFGQNASQAKNYADMLTYAFYHGIPDINGLNQAINATGGMAAAMHVPFSEMVAMLDLLGQAGLSGSTAGTALRYMLQSMYEPTQKQANELETLGIITSNKVTPAFEELYAHLKAGDSSLPAYDGTVSGLYNIWAAAKKVGEIPASSSFLQWADSVGMLKNAFYDANGKQLDFMQAFGILIQHIQQNSKTPQEFSDTLGQMFNVKSGQGFADVVGNIEKLTGLNKGLQDATKGAGLAATDQQKVMSSQTSQWTALQTTITDFMAQAGVPIQNFFQGVFGWLNDVIGKFTTGSPAVHQFFTVFLIAGTVASGVALLVFGVMALNVALQFITKTATGTAIGLGGILGPMALVMVGIVAFAAIAALVITHWSQIQQFFHNLVTWLHSAWEDILSFFSSHVVPVFVGVAQAIVGAWNNVVSFFGGVKDAIVNFVSSSDPWLVLLKSVIEGIGIALLVSVLPKIIIFVVQSLIHFTMLAVQSAVSFGQMAASAIASFVSMAASGIAQTALMVGRSVAGFVVMGATATVQFALMAGRAVVSFAIMSASAIAAGAAMLLPFLPIIAIGAVIGAVVGGVILLIQHWGAVSTWLGGIWTGVSTAIGNFIHGVIAWFQHLFDVLVGHSIIPDLVKEIFGWFLQLVTLPYRVIGGLIGGFIGGAKSLASALWDHVIHPLIQAFEELPGKALQWASNMITMFIQGIEHGLSNLIRSLGWIGNRVADMLGFHSPTKEGPLSKSGEWMPNMMNMLAQGVVDGAPKLQSAALHAANILHGAFTTPGISATQTTFATSTAMLSGGNTTIPISFDGKVVTQVVLNRLTGQLQMAGSGRLNR